VSKSFAVRLKVNKHEHHTSISVTQLINTWWWHKTKILFK